MNLIDSHCHLDYPGLAEDLGSVLARAEAAGVRLLLSIGTRVRKFDQVLAIAERHDNVFCTVGTHPHNAAEEPDVTADELVFPTKGWAGFTVRTFDLEKRQWSIYWIDSRSGRLEAPVVGGFDGALGEFYGEDSDAGRAVKVRYRWHKLDQDHARWEQAFSYDGRSWETNWSADFTRADAQRNCRDGRPRR